MNTMRRSLSTPFAARLLAALSFSALLAACVGDLPDDFNNDGTGGDTSGPTTTTGGGGNTTTTTTGGGGTGGQAQAGTFMVSASSPAMAAELRSDTTIPVTINTTDFTGTVDLSVTGLPADVTATFNPPSVTLDGAAATSTLTLTTRSDTVTGTLALTVTGTSGAATQTAAIDFDVAPVITVMIPQNVATLINTTNSFGAYPTMIKAPPNLSAANPLMVRFFNADNVPHQIHASNDAQGFPHSNVNIPAGAFDPLDRPVNAPGTYNFYMHDVAMGDTIDGQIVIAP